MALTYPLTPPTAPAPGHSSISWVENNFVAISSSPFTGQTQAHSWGGGYWGIEVSFDPMDRADAAQWIGFLSALRGQYGTFYFGDELTKTAQGTAAGVPLVNGGSQSGYSLVADGWNASETVLIANDRIQVGSSLYRVVKDCISDGSGNATIEIWPALKSHANNSSIVVSNCKGVFRLAGNQSYEAIPRSKFWNISFQALEVL